jgi:hypothetical protein
VAIVLIADQVASSSRPDLVASASRALNRRHADGLELPFVRTAGDEMQAVLRSPVPLAALAAELLDDRAWHLGIGLGTVERYGASSRDSAGPAFQAARLAIEAAKHDRSSPGPVAVRGEPEQLAAWMQAALGARDFIRSRRTPRQREIIAAVAGAPSAKAAAERLGITPQTISRALAVAGHEPERQLAALIDGLAGQVIAA